MKDKFLLVSKCMLNVMFFCGIPVTLTVPFTLKWYGQINDYYKNKSAWRKSALLNIAHVGKFSSDRTIQEYVDDIWHLDRITVNMAGV